MEIVQFIQKFFLLFLPGIIGMLLYNQINIREEQQGYVESLKLVCLSLASYLLTDALFLILRLIPGFPWGPVNIVEVIAAEEIRLPTANVFTSVTAAIGITFFLTMANDEGWTASIAERLSAKRRRRIEESRKLETEREAVWPAILEEGKAVVLQDFVTGYAYYGRMEKMSDRDGRMEILLRDVRMINDESHVEYRVKVLYLSRNHNEFNIEIQNHRNKKQRDADRREEMAMKKSKNKSVEKPENEERDEREQDEDGESTPKVELRWVGPGTVEVIGGEDPDPDFVPHTLPSRRSHRSSIFN